VFAGGPSGWHGRADSLTAEQIRRLASEPVRARAGRVVLSEDDERMLAVLARDGRTGYPDIAIATGWSQMTATRRLAQLRRSGALFFDIDIDPNCSASKHSLYSG